MLHINILFKFYKSQIFGIEDRTLCIFDYCPKPSHLAQKLIVFLGDISYADRFLLIYVLVVT